MKSAFSNFTACNMCGPEFTNRPRGGALAALSAPNNKPHCTDCLNGDLAFHTPGQPGSSEATHARFTPSQDRQIDDMEKLRIVIQYVMNSGESIK